MLYSYATKWIGGFLLMCATLSSRATLTTSLPTTASRRIALARHKGTAAEPPADGCGWGDDELPSGRPM